MIVGRPDPIRPEQIRAIHAIATRLRMPDADYRALLSGYGVRSSKELSEDKAAALLARMRALPGASRPVEGASKSARDRAEGRFAPKLQALWIAGWNLGVVRDRTDAALQAFVTRQTQLSHTRFLRDPAEAIRVIEALKAWLERDGGVDWPTRTNDPGLDLMADKRAVLTAQWRRGLALGALKAVVGLTEEAALAAYVGVVTRGGSRALGAFDCPSVTPAELDAASAALGRKLRQALARQAAARHGLAEGER